MTQDNRTNPQPSNDIDGQPLLPFTQAEETALRDALALDGAEIVASLAAWPVCRQRPALRVAQDRQTRHFNLTDAARAVENQVVWVSSNQVGRLGRLRFPGQAKVVDPDGRVLARTGARAGTALARIDAPGLVAAARNEMAHLDDRCPAAYGALPAVA